MIESSYPKQLNAHDTRIEITNMLKVEGFDVVLRIGRDIGKPNYHSRVTEELAIQSRLVSSALATYRSFC